MDYTILALESSIEDLKMFRTHKQELLREQSEFIISCLDTGLVVLREAEENKPKETNTTETKPTSPKKSILGKMGDTIRAFFEKIKSLFRTKAVEQSKKHTDWIKKNRDHISKIAAKMTIEALPYWEGNYKQQIGTIKAAVDGAIRNIEAKKFDHSYISKIVSPQHVGDKNLVEYLKNYYRIGERDKLEIKQVKIGGKDLVDKVEGMLVYTINYVGSSVPEVNNLSDTIVKSLDKLGKSATGKAKPTGFTISSESFLDIEGCKVCESDLVSCMNYSAIFEANENQSTKPEETKKTEVTDSEGNQTTSTTKVTVSSDSDTNETSKVEEKSQEEIEFVNEVTSVIKLLYSAFTTVMEERYITYTNILRAIGNSKSMEVKEEEGGEKPQEDTPKEEPKEEKPEPKKKKKGILSKLTRSNIKK